jgi:hypothetical protein
VCQSETEWVLLENEMGMDMSDPAFSEMTDEEIVDMMIEEHPLPVPGESYDMGDGQHLCVTPNATYMKSSEYLGCFIEFDQMTGSTVLNTSYIEILNENNILDELFIGKIMMNHLYMLDTLQYNCTLAPVTKITDIIYDETTNIIRIHIIEPKLTEYMNEMTLNLTNKTLYDLNRINSMVGMERLAQSLAENNVESDTLTLNEFVCYEYDSNGEVIGVVDSSLCESEDIIEEMGTIYGSNGFIDSTQVNTVRRRLIWGWLKSAVTTIVNVVKDVVEDIIDFVETIVDIVTGDVDERFSLGGLSVSESASWELSGNIKERETANGQGTLSGSGEFTVEAGASFNLELYIDFEAQYELFSFNPSFDSMRIAVGTEILLDSYLNVDLTGELNLEYRIFEIGKRKVFFLGPIPVVIEMFSELNAYLDLAFDVSMSFNAGIEPIVFEFGAEYIKGNGWNRISTATGIVPYFNVGSVLGDNEEEESSACFSASAVPALELKFGVVFYELLTVYTAFTFENEMSVTYPGTCDGTDACELATPQLGFGMEVVMPITIGIELGSDELGLDTIGIEYEIATIDIYETSTCANVFIAPLYYPCCGYPETLYPTPNPTPKPTIKPTAVTSSPTRKPTLPNGSRVPMSCSWSPNDPFDSTWTRGCSSGLNCPVFNGVASFHSNEKEDRVFSWYTCTPTETFDNLLYSHSFTDLSTTSYDAEWWRRCPEDSQVVQIQSSHSNAKEDRIFNIRCAKYANTRHENCYWTGWDNNYDEEVYFKCANNGVMNSIHSRHDNYYEDRQWDYKCCDLVYDF